MDKKPTDTPRLTPATVQIVAAGGAKLAEATKPLAEQVPLVYETYRDVEQRAFSFDLKNYIEESVLEHTRPLLLKTNEYLTTVTTMQANLESVSTDYREHKLATNTALNDCVRLLEFRLRLQEFEKRMGVELNQVQDDLGKLDKVVELHDQKVDKHAIELEALDARVLLLRDRADAVITYSNIVAKKQEDQSMQIQKDMAARHDELQVMFMDLETRFEAQNVQVDTNKILCQKAYDSVEKQKAESTVWFEKEKADLDRKLKFQAQQQDIKTVRMGARLTDDFIYSCKRLRQKLLYQIGLTDDPWKEKDNFVMDDVYSQNKADMQEFLRAKRSSSFDKFTGHGARHDVDKVM